MKYFSMFSGIGGFELGIKKAYSKRHSSINSINKHKEQSEPDCIGFSEIDKYAIQTYQKHFTHKNFGNARGINPESLPFFDVLVGGFPCQSFSIAGKRKGFEDTRGTLFFEIARIVAAKKPKMLFLENVKGLLNHDAGSTFAKILETLWELGYDVEWCVLNSKNFGVPQNRERVFIIGHLGGSSGSKIFPLPNNVKKIAKKIKVKGYLHGIYNGKTIRRLTPTECERLQGFPDGWTEGVSDTQRYKCLGNAVTVNVIEAITPGLMDEVCSL